MESASGLSTYCRKCGKYYKIEHPKSNKGGLLGLFGFKKDSKPQVSTSTTAPKVPLQMVGFSEEGQIMAQSVPDHKSAPVEKESQRSVDCFDCHHTHKVSRASTSSLCPQCGCYIDLRDVVIRERTTQKIRTRGDVLVEKKAALLGTSITCGNLTVYGQISGSIYASGDVIFKTSGKVLGEVRCRNLLIEKKSEIQFLQPIQCESALIHGEITGKLTCAKKLEMTKHAAIHGSVATKSMKLAPGAKLNGPMQILSRPISILFSEAPAPKTPPPSPEAAPPEKTSDEPKQSESAPDGGQPEAGDTPGEAPKP